jgi:cell division transport system permease protein
VGVSGVSLDYVAKETVANLWRNRVMALAGVLTVAVSLSLVGTALLLRQAVSTQISRWSHNISLQIFVKADATKSQTAYIRSLIGQTPQIQRCTYLDHEQSYQQAREVLVNEPSALQVLTPATTPPVFNCQLKNPNEAATVASVFQSGVPGVYSAVYPAKSIKVMESVTNVIQIILLVIAIVLLASSLVLILNAIRMAIFARRREVSVMKLVGATNWFIRVPFMLEGLVQGLLGAVVAVVIVLLSNYGVTYLVNHYHVSVLSAALPTRQLVTTELLVVVVGMVVGVLGSSLAVRRFLDV